MFTGLVQDVGKLVGRQEVGGPVRITVEPDRLEPAELELGESIATSGVCLTVVGLTDRGFTADLGKETLDVTTAGRWRVGRRLNLERSLALGDKLGGHLVMGHVDGTGRVERREAESGVLHLEIAMPDPIAPLVCAKGSIAIDGTSLTVNRVTRSTLQVTLIPETLARTTLGELAVGDAVNLEADILARQLARMMAFGLGTDEAGGSRLDLSFLARHGYAGDE